VPTVDSETGGVGLALRACITVVQDAPEGECPDHGDGDTPIVLVPHSIACTQPESGQERAQDGDVGQRPLAEGEHAEAHDTGCWIDSLGNGSGFVNGTEMEASRRAANFSSCVE